MQVLEVAMPQRNDSKEALRRWFYRVQNEFGQASGQAIIKSFIEECGRCRLSVPDMQNLNRQARDERMRYLFWVKKYSYEQLSINFDGLCIPQVRRIVHMKTDKHDQN
jgi:hypothetical protein